jgi:hypothetical protein
MRITEMIDDKGFNLLHHAVLKGRHDKLQALLDFARDN